MKKYPSLNSAISFASYRIYGDGLTELKSLDREMEHFLQLNSYQIVREKKDGEISIDIRPYVASLTKNKKELELDLKISPNGTAKAEEVMRALVPNGESVPGTIYYERSGLYVKEKGLKRTPMEILEEI